MYHIGKIPSWVPHDIEAKAMDLKEKILYYTGQDPHIGDMEWYRSRAVNVGTVGHVDWGRVYQYTGRRHYSDEPFPPVSYHGRRKLGDVYLSWHNGGLLIGDRVVWVVEDGWNSYVNDKAAEAVLPTKEYVKEIVTHYLGESHGTR